MRRCLLRRALASGSLALAAATLLVPAAVAADAGGEAMLDYAQPSEAGVELLVSLPADSDPDLDGVEVTIGGEQVEASGALATEQESVRRTAILAIDTSISMRGARIAAAEAAAVAYLDTVPTDVEVGVVTFDSTVTTLLDPTRDRDAARAAVTDLQLSRQTALYDGVLGAIEAAGPEGEDSGQRRVLVLSDGRDSTATPLSEALRSVESSGVLLDVVALQQSGPGAVPLQLLADAGRGQVLDAADPAALEATFAAEAEALARQVVVTAAVPEGVESSADVSVTLAQNGAAPVVVSAFLDVRGELAEQAAAEAAAQQDARAAAAARAEVDAPPPMVDLSAIVVWGGVAAIGLGLLGIAYIATTTSSAPSREDRLRKQLQAYGVFGGDAAASTSSSVDPTTSSFGDQARGAAQRALADRADLEAKIATRLEGAGVHFKPAEWLLLHGGIVIGATTLGLLLGRGNLVLPLLGLVLGSVLPWVYLGFKRSRRLKAFAGGLADTLQLMSGSLSAGLSLAQSIDTIVREGADPISGEFRRIVVETRLGVPLEDAMETVAERMESRDFEWVVMAIRIQREVGGNLAELLLQVAATLREREYLRRHVRALSAEGRLSAWVLGSLPPGFLLYLAVSRPDYVSVFWNDPRGWIMLGGAGVLMAVGVLWMSKVAKVDF